MRVRVPAIMYIYLFVTICQIEINRAHARGKGMMSDKGERQTR